MLKNNQTGTGWPVLVDQNEEHNIDFRVPGLSHSVAKEAEHLRVQEIAKRIEDHREALHADLQQNNAYNLFSTNSKEMIFEGNVQLFELFETIQKYNVPIVFFIGIKELCIVLADNSYW